MARAAFRMRTKRDLWTRWCLLIESSWQTRGGPRGDEASARIVDALGHAPATLDYRLETMAKGYALMRAAYLDFEPSIGSSRTAKAPSRLDRLRGLQWRLVMSVGGFEMFLRGRLGREEKIWRMVGLASKLIAMEPPPPVPRPRVPPGGAPCNLEGWLDLPLAPTEKSRLAEFLGLNRFEEELLLGWLRGTTAPSGWEGHARLAAALRNVTAHGALSASKARELRLRWAFVTLPTILLDLACATLEGPVAALGAAPRPKP